MIFVIIFDLLLIQGASTTSTVFDSVKTIVLNPPRLSIPWKDRSVGAPIQTWKPGRRILIIDVQSEVGEEASFKIYLPATEPFANSASETISVTDLGGSENVLIADDDINILQLMESILKGAGYSVITATDGHETHGLLKEHKDRIDLTLLDEGLHLIKKPWKSKDLQLKIREVLDSKDRH